MQLSRGFTFEKQLTGGSTLIATPGTRIWAGETISYCQLIESMQVRVSQPSLGQPGALPPGLEDMGNVDASEAYRSWQWTQPRRHLDIVRGGKILGTVCLLNRVPFYTINLMPFLSRQSTSRVESGKSVELRVIDVGFGPLSSQDYIVAYGEGVEEADVEDLQPQFSDLKSSLLSEMRSTYTGLSNRLAALEEWTIAQSPKIAALQAQGASNTLDLAQAVTDIGWMRRNWGSGTSGGTGGGGETVTPLTSIPGATSPDHPGSGKFRILSPGRYKLRISIAPALLDQVPTGDPKTIEVVSWSEEPNNTVLSWGDEVNTYNWNSSGIVRWVADLPRNGGDVWIDATAQRKWFGVKVRNTNKRNWWGGPHSHYLDGVFAVEQPLAGYSAEWVAKSF